MNYDPIPGSLDGPPLPPERLTFTRLLGRVIGVAIIGSGLMSVLLLVTWLNIWLFGKVF